jgi:hypothetical protein
LDVLRGGFGDDAAEHQARDAAGVAYPELQRGLGGVAVALHDRAVQPSASMNAAQSSAMRS